MNIRHTAEQLEAAARDGNKITATRIILRHLRATDPTVTLGRAAALAELYFLEPHSAIAAIVSWSPELGI